MPSGQLQRDGRQDPFDLGPTGLELRRQLQIFAEMLGRLIGGEARAISRNLEKDAVRLAKINRVKIKPVDHRRNLEPKIDNAVAPFDLLRFVRTPERYVMNGAAGVHTETALRPLNDLDLATRRCCVDRESLAFARLRHQFKAKRLQKFFAPRQSPHLECRRVETADRKFLRYVALVVKIDIIEVRRRD